MSKLLVGLIAAVLITLSAPIKADPVIVPQEMLPKELGDYCVPACLVINPADWEKMMALIKALRAKASSI